MLDFLKRWVRNFGKVLQIAFSLFVTLLSTATAIAVPMVIVGMFAALIFAFPPLGLLWSNQVAATLGLVVGFFASLSFMATIEKERIFKYGDNLWPDD